MYKGYDIYSPKSIEEYGKTIENNTFRDILKSSDSVVKESGYEYLSAEASKGSLGQLVEKYHFKYEPNSDRKPDFEEAGVELKVTPFKRLKSGKLSAKERLVLNIINYEEIVEENFENSSFWLKNQLILLIHYLYEKDKDKLDYLIKKVQLYEFPEKDLKVIKDDWNYIRKKVLEGRAHKLSEGDTNYLGACTKGATKNSLRSQPFSGEMAMQRAFALKTSYMTALLRQMVDNDELVGFSNEKDLQEKSLEDLLMERFKPYIGLKPEQIAKQVNIQYKKNSKHMIPQLISAILGIRGTRLDEIDEFAKANIEYKTVRLEPNGISKEHMSFEQIRFHEVYNETWENSHLRKRFIDTKFLFVIFQFKETKAENKDRQPYFKGIKLWNMPEDILDTKIRNLWYEINKLVREGVEIEYKKRGHQIVESNNFPNKDFNGVAHVRPKGRDGTDKVRLPDGQMVTKQCYWLNNSFIASLIN
ncbi:Sau3AI family type II restriction endonuclease [Tenuibacillus multivorans]|uniref:DNA mismatch repair enzyme MutH n=1 Tax=Tenuibacillus multivorans TaxID=237069 RepID=A0A1G9WKA6_9BACI|nr:Sau3AI family type II restriction endonuclease [Tenuibacillus multivorans]GEL76489.1 DNA mismatch repair protein MutH [Tenuibacillus multivorans]SDM84601.1 DNA mismatch repair enzyme MutH [Tenuibacillus multivorans]